MATIMLYTILNTIQKLNTVVQSSTQLEMYIFGQVTQKQMHFKTFDTDKIYNATFEIVPNSNNILSLKKMFRNFQTRKVEKQFVYNYDHELYCLLSA